MTDFLVFLDELSLKTEHLNSSTVFFLYCYVWLMKILCCMTAISTRWSSVNYSSCHYNPVGIQFKFKLTNLRKPVLYNPGEERGTVKSISLKFLISCFSRWKEAYKYNRERDCLSLSSLLFFSLFLLYFSSAPLFSLAWFEGGMTALSRVMWRVERACFWQCVWFEFCL